MARNKWHKILNPFLALLAANQAVTVVFRDELSHRTFQIFHQYGGAVLLVLIAVHFILNFNWVRANYFSK